MKRLSPTREPKGARPGSQCERFGTAYPATNSTPTGAPSAAGRRTELPPRRNRGDCPAVPRTLKILGSPGFVAEGFAGCIDSGVINVPISSSSISVTLWLREKICPGAHPARSVSPGVIINVCPTVCAKPLPPLLIHHHAMHDCGAGNRVGGAELPVRNRPVPQLRVGRFVRARFAIGKV